MPKQDTETTIEFKRVLGQKERWHENPNGRRVPVPQTAVIGEGVVIEDDVRIGPRAKIYDGAILKEGCQIGAGATVAGDVTVGFKAKVCNHATASKDVPDGATVAINVKPPTTD